jgi:hypothetical protein
LKATAWPFGTGGRLVAGHPPAAGSPPIQIVRYDPTVATELHLDPDLAAVVKAARERAEESGELPRGTFPPPEATIPSEAAPAIAAWLRDGGYDAAIERIAVEDPDLANQ